MRIVLKPVGAVVLIAAIGLLTFLAWRSSHSKENSTTPVSNTSPLAPAIPATTNTALILYKDGLLNGWQDQAGTKKIDYRNSNPVHGKTGTSIRVEAGPNEGMKIHHAAAVDIANDNYLLFFIHGGEKAGQSLSVAASASGKSTGHILLPPLEPNKWLLITIPLTKLGVQGRPDLEGISIRNESKKAMPPFFVDDIQLSTTDTPFIVPEIVSPWAKPQPD